MKRRYELEDGKGRYLTAEYDEEEGLLMVTTYLHPEPDVSIEQTLKEAGFQILSKMDVVKPQVVKIGERKTQ